MLVRDIISFIKDRTGESNDATIIREINNVYRKLYYETDLEGSIQELDVLPNAQKIVTLPYYVYAIKAVKRPDGTPQVLNTPRAYYQEYSYRQSACEWRILSRTPLFRSLENPGPLRFRLKKLNTESFIVNVRAADAYGVDNREELNFTAATRELTTQGSYVDVLALSKDKDTIADVEVYDIRSNLVSVLPSTSNEVWCLKVQIVDSWTSSGQVTAAYTVLFKKHPTLVSSEYDSVPDSIAIQLQRLATAARLSTRTEPNDRQAADKFSAEVTDFQRNTTRNQNDGITARLDLKPSPWTTSWTGII